MTYAQQVVEACQALITEDLARWTSGNASVVDRGQDLIFIKPSGVKPKDLDDSKISVVDFTTGEHVGGLKPSTDTDSHLEIYRAFDVGAIIHTHSTYATAWAACGREIPCVITAMADEFGGPIRCAPYAEIGGRAIAAAIGGILIKYKNQRAVLIRQHGVFTFGKNLDEALKAAVLVEDCAKTIAIADKLGILTHLLPAQITSNFERYSKTYGQ